MIIPACITIKLRYSCRNRGTLVRTSRVVIDCWAFLLCMFSSITVCHNLTCYSYVQLYYEYKENSFAAKVHNIQITLLRTMAYFFVMFIMPY